MLLRRSGLALVVFLLLAAPAQAAKHCAEPAPGPEGWERATPAEAGMDAGRLAEAMGFGTTQASFAVRVYRHGCLVAEDGQADGNRHSQYESWSMAKSVTSLVFGRAMSLGKIQPQDPLGSLVPEADAAHGAITLHDLLTMTSGLRWNGLRDYDLATPDRVRDALLTPVEKTPGTYWEYSQSGTALVAEATGRAVEEDFQAFAQRELFGPLGITPGSWRWTRDLAGHTLGFVGLQMVPDDFARLGELLRRGGVWKGQRLLSKRYVKEALTTGRTSGCYGYLIWVNSGKPCIGARLVHREVNDRRRFTEVPEDTFFYAGLFGQIVTVFPTQGIVIERNGQDLGGVKGGPGWEGQLYTHVLGAITDTPFVPPADAPATPTVDRSDPDRGFQTSITIDALQPILGGNLPPAGPARARALLLTRAAPRVTKRGVIRVLAICPATSRCVGTVSLGDAGRRAATVDLFPNTQTVVALRLKRPVFRALRRSRLATYDVGAVLSAAGGDTPSTLSVRVRRPRP